jgi:hypothetical protein
MDTVLDTPTFERHLLRHLILHVLKEAIQLVHVICEEDYFANLQISHESKLKREEAARVILWTTLTCIQNEPFAVDMNIRHFVPRNKPQDTSLLEDIEHKLQLSVFERFQIKCIRDIISCSSEKFEKLMEEYTKYQLLPPLPFLAVYRARR